MCTPRGTAATAKEIGTMGNEPSENREGQVGHLGLFDCFCADTCIADKRGVDGMAPKLQPEEAPKKPREAEAQAAEVAQQEVAKQATEAAPVPKEAKLQAPKESTKHPAGSAPKEAKPQAPKEAAKQLAQAASPKE